MECNTYKTLLGRLLSINAKGGMKLGLENPLTLSRHLNDPHQEFRTVHVAGTNGKGSVSNKIAKALKASGYRTGLYTSPHIASFRERIRIDGAMISEKDAAKWLDKIFALIDEFAIPATFFEVTTLLCFAYFAEQKVDFAVIETGLGGRLDATNIIQPELSIITSIALEHTEILGATTELIAKEKAGIIKPFIPVVIGPKVPLEVIYPIAQAKKSLMFAVTGEFADYHAENNAIAKKALEFFNINKADIAIGLNAAPPCRTEIIQKCNLDGVKKQFVLDVAHNPDGLLSLMTYLKRHFHDGRFTFVLGLSSNKDIRSCLEVIKGHGRHFHLVEANSSRAVSRHVLSECLQSLGVSKNQISLSRSSADTITFLMQNGEDETVVVCGTFFIMNEVRIALGLIDCQDELNLNE